jgi:hypothetical protein
MAERELGYGRKVKSATVATRNGEGPQGAGAFGSALHPRADGMRQEPRNER